MKLNFNLRQLGFIDNVGNLCNYYTGTYDNICCFPIRGQSETDAYWNRVKDCIGFVKISTYNYYTTALRNRIWIQYILKKL